MPELPELEVIVKILERRALQRPIERVWASGRGGPIILRNLVGGELAGRFQGQRFDSVRRRGKFLLFTLAPSGLFLVINPKLTGRLQLSQPGERRRAHTHVVFSLEDPPGDLRYLDSKRMGQIYLTSDPGAIPGFKEQGPEPLEIDLETFVQRLRPFRGEIKGVLTRGRLIAGIGNAYADEILWAARIHPFRPCTDLSPTEIEALFHALRTTLIEAIEQVRREMDEQIELKPRGFFAVHLKQDEPCPRCGGAISSVTAGGRITNFCRNCQPGGLFKGMAGRRP